eukprot:m51a1_g10197 hypothetical protein (443) ;mRNA; f:32727-41194
MWDRPPYHSVAATAPPSGQRLCPRGVVYSARYFQLFAPPRVPWKYTRVCFTLLSNSTAKVKGDISVHPPDLAPDSVMMMPSQATASMKFQLTVDPAEPWQTVDLTSSQTELSKIGTECTLPDTAAVSWTKQVFLSVYYWSCDYIAVNVSIAGPGRLTFMSKQMMGWYPLYSDTSATLNTVKAITIRAEGTAARALPVGWMCAESLYWDSKCDCNCGAWDPSCAANPHSDDCLTKDAVCDQTGVCTGLDWNETLCNATNYWANDGCHKKGTTICSEMWTCNESKFNDGKFCDCGCGIQDPDCYIYPPVPTSCHDNWQCINGVCLVPRVTYSARYFQLFTPPRVPWKYTSVCFTLLSNATTKVKGVISVHPPDLAPGEDLMVFLSVYYWSCDYIAVNVSVTVLSSQEQECTVTGLQFAMVPQMGHYQRIQSSTKVSNAMMRTRR